MRKIIFADDAKRELAEIYESFDSYDSSSSSQFASRVRSICKLLVQQPLLGRSRDELVPGLRSIVVDSHILFFKTTTSELRILHVIHGSRDQRLIDWSS